MIHSLLFALSLFAPREPLIVVPENTPFAIEGAEQEYGNPVRFKGELRFEGRYQFDWLVIDGKPESLELRIFPNEADLKLIPFDEDRPVSELLVRNAEVVARSILGGTDAQRLLGGKVLVKAGVGVFRVGAMETAVDCDYRSYVVDVIVAEPAQFLVDIEIMPLRVGC